MRKSGRLNGSEGMPMQRAGLAPARVNPVVQHPHEQRVSLGGEWRFRLDPDDRGVAEGWHGAPESMAERIQVPGCWQGQGFGGDGTDRVRDFNLEARVFRRGVGERRAGRRERNAICAVRVRHHVSCAAVGRK